MNTKQRTTTLYFLAVFFLLAILLSGCGSTGTRTLAHTGAPLVPKDGYWLNDSGEEYTFTVYIQQSQVQWVKLQGKKPDGAITLQCNYLGPIPVQQDNSFSSIVNTDVGNLSINGVFYSPETGHVSFEIEDPWCKGITSTGQKARFEGTVQNETDIKFDH